MFFTSPSRLRKAGIVGMNRRNVVMIAQNNPRRLYPLVDNKLKTKEILEKAGIATPTLLGVVRSQAHVRELESFLARHNDFVLKPAKEAVEKAFSSFGANRKTGSSNPVGRSSLQPMSGATPPIP